MNKLPMSLKTTSIEKPMILKGRRISQRSGKRKTNAIAKGQHSTNKMHQRINVARVLIKNLLVKTYSIIRPIH